MDLFDGNTSIARNKEGGILENHGHLDPVVEFQYNYERKRQIEEAGDKGVSLKTANHSMNPGIG
jgi:hypothetical protein